MDFYSIIKYFNMFYWEAIEVTNNILIKAAKHFNLVNKHRWEVFKLCCKAGIPYRGLVHDLSKYSPTEFWESAKYFDGHKKSDYIC